MASEECTLTKVNEPPLHPAPVSCIYQAVSTFDLPAQP
jgi:hypothetical protein